MMEFVLSAGCASARPTAGPAATARTCARTCSTRCAATTTCPTTTSAGSDSPLAKGENLSKWRIAENAVSCSCWLLENFARLSLNFQASRVGQDH